MTPSTGRSAATGGVHGRRICVTLVTALAAWLLIVVRLAVIQVAHGPRLAACAERQHVVRVRLAPERGTIYDRHMVPLTDNLTVQSVCAYPSEIESPSYVARGLARALGGRSSQYASKLRDERGFVWVARQLPPSTTSELSAMNLPGVGFLKECKRVYPYAKRACHVIGMTDVDGRGLSGVEHEADDLLAGSDAWVCHYLDSRGRRNPTPACTKVAPCDGTSVVLTIDLGLQSIAEVELERAVREHGAKSGIVIIQDPWTGEILALANWPTFDPNHAQRYSADARRNRAITDQFEPGSTFKLITACAALSSGAADLSSVYHASRGSRRFQVFTIHDVTPHGWLDFGDAFAKSSNICFAEIASRTGDGPLYACARDFGFGVPTGITLPGEARGYIREPSEWTRRSVYSVGIGQEVAVTALQLVSAYAAIANGGCLMEPQIVKAVVSEDGSVAQVARPWPVRKVIDEDLAATLKNLLTEVTEIGTGRKAAVGEFQVAGKTGTAQKTIEGVRGYAPGKFVSSFVGFAPAADPKIVCLVVIDEPEGRGLGGEVAAPVFKGIVERIVRGPAADLVFGDVTTPRAYAQAEPPDAGTPAAGPHDEALTFADEAYASQRHSALVADAFTNADGGGLARGARGGHRFDARAVFARLLFVESSVTDGDVRVPDLTGMSIRMARRTAASRGLLLSSEGSGTVRRQSPRPGSAAEAGDRVVVRCYPS